MRTIELGPEVNAQIEFSHGGKRLLRTGQRDREVSAQAKQRLGRAVDHRLHRLNGIVSVCLGRLETEHIFDLFQESAGGLFGYAYGPVSLHVRMSAQRTDARTGFAKVAAQ